MSYVTEFPISSAVKLVWRNILCARKFGLSRRPSRGVRQVCKQWVYLVISYGMAQVQMKLAIAHFQRLNDAGHRDGATMRLHVQ